MRLVLFVLAIGVITLTSVLSMIGSSQPHWIEQTVDAPSPSTKLRISYGLFEKCDQSILEPDVWTCHTFPLDGQDCVDPAGLGTGHLYAQNALTLDDDEDLPDGKPLFWSVLRESSPLALFARTRRSSSFCNYWRLAGYFSQMSLAFGAAGVLSLLVVLGGGRRKRRTAWPVCAAFVLLHAVFQLALWSIVLHAYRTEKRFQNSTAHLSYSFGFATTAWILDVLLASVMVFTGLYGEWEIPQKSERAGLIGSRSYGTLPGSDERVPRVSSYHSVGRQSQQSGH